MTNSSLKALLLVCLLAASFAVSADDRPLKDGYRGANVGQWRLGGFDGRRGYEIYHRDRGGWYRVPGSATALGDGWVLGTDRRSGGYGIYRWNGRSFDRAPGGAVEIGGTYNRPWVINNRGERFIWNGYNWDATGYNARPRARGRISNGFSNRDQRRPLKRDRRRWN